MIKWITLVALVLLQIGCVRIINAPDFSASGSSPQNETSTMAHVQQMSLASMTNIETVGTALELKSGKFTNRFLLQPAVDKQHLRIYIEADKYGWLNSESTMVKGLGYQLYQQDSRAIYAQYPCMNANLSGCNSLYRQGQRFATEQAGALASMLAQLKQQMDAQTLEVIAVGDAAALILKVAAVSEVIDYLHTIDGTLSPAIWARRIKQPPPLSSDPLIYHRKLQRLAQTHWVASRVEGAEQMAQAFKDSFADPSCVRIRLVNGSYSLQNWRDMWPLLVNSRFRCEE